MSDEHVTLEKAYPPAGGLEQSASSAVYDPEAPARRGGRFWSARRVPAALLALLILAASGLLLYDVAAVRARQQAMSWRRSLAEELAATRIDSVPVLAGASFAALLGVVLIVMALTPGLRTVLSMRRESPEVRAGLERSAAELVLRDRAMDVSGVQSVRVLVGRGKVRARAEAHFRDLDLVRADVDAALDEGIRQLGLDRPLSLSVRVRRPAKR
ncbi:DUF6286 domain-containing protein [Streptomyces sulphureus]|uniref:DUF6286 domain-containing protein n=1 Tax=Streptomyces sulphureus TaxID=47758 RepID=UPI00035E1B4C|nr:DUF6286 domain-containing protein [Streptomyces sulphureus]